jgi:hypothetical protein
MYLLSVLKPAPATAVASAGAFDNHASQVRAVETARLAARVGTARSAATSQQQSLQHLLEARERAQAQLDELNKNNAAVEQKVGHWELLHDLLGWCLQVSPAGLPDQDVLCLPACMA